MDSLRTPPQSAPGVGFRLGACVSWGSRFSNTWPRVPSVNMVDSELQADILFDLSSIHHCHKPARELLPQEVGNSSLYGL